MCQALFISTIEKPLINNSQYLYEVDAINISTKVLNELPKVI